MARKDSTAKSSDSEATSQQPPKSSSSEDTASVQKNQSETSAGQLAEGKATHPPINPQTKIFIAALGVLTIVGLLTWQGVTTANENAQVERLSQRAELVAQRCADIIGQHVPEVKSASVVSHSSSLQRVTVNFEGSSGGDIGDRGQCKYSMEDNVLSVESIEWEFERDNVVTDVSYDRTTNVVSFERVPPAPQKTEGTAETSASCESAFRAAAAVPLSRDNNPEVAQTTRACSDVDEWWGMLKRYPATFGVSNFLESEKGLYVGSACLVGQGSPVCQDAVRLGLVF